MKGGAWAVLFALAGGCVSNTELGEAPFTPPDSGSPTLAQHQATQLDALRAGVQGTWVGEQEHTLYDFPWWDPLPAVRITFEPDGDYEVRCEGACTGGGPFPSIRPNAQPVPMSVVGDVHWGRYGVTDLLRSGEGWGRTRDMVDGEQWEADLQRINLDEDSGVLTFQRVQLYLDGSTSDNPVLLELHRVEGE